MHFRLEQGLIFVCETKRVFDLKWYRTIGVWHQSTATAISEQTHLRSAASIQTHLPPLFLN